MFLIFCIQLFFWPMPMPMQSEIKEPEIILPKTDPYYDLIIEEMMSSEKVLFNLNEIGVDKENEEFRNSFVKFGLIKEILDPRELRYIFCDPMNIDEDIITLRDRYSLLKDAPLLHELNRFPMPYSVLKDLIVFNRNYQKKLDELQILNHDKAEIYRSAKLENNYLYNVYDNLADAKCRYYFTTMRRMSFLKFKCLLPEEEYINGILPPHVPAWRFIEE